jgi:hypothetical protein
MQSDCLELAPVIGGITLRMIQGTMFFDRQTPLRGLATATLRGLTGHLLKDLDIKLAMSYFKPPQEKPAALVFQSIHGGRQSQSEMAFRIISWAPGDHLSQALCAAYSGLPGKCFGESGSIIKAVNVEKAQTLNIEPETHARAPARLTFHTPLMIRKGGRPMGAADLHLAALITAAVRRINRVSAHYGNGKTLSEQCFSRVGDVIREIRRDMAWVSPRRRSCVQGQNIALSGWVGHMAFDSFPPELVDLFNVIACIHLGRHTTEGCGQLSVEPGT